MPKGFFRVMKPEFIWESWSGTAVHSWRSERKHKAPGVSRGESHCVIKLALACERRLPLAYASLAHVCAYPPAHAGGFMLSLAFASCLVMALACADGGSAPRAGIVSD